MTEIERKNLRRHKQTVRTHRRIVRKMCFKLGIPWLGLMHDLSKHSKAEVEIGKYADGTRSPHDIARDQLGYSPSWVYHKGKNPHHWEFWCDYNSATYDKTMNRYILIPVPVKMPYKYVIEMFCDFVGAGMAYSGDKWTTSAPIDYYNNSCKGKRCMHPESEALLVELCTKLSRCDFIDEFVFWYKTVKKDLIQKYNYVEEEVSEEVDKSEITEANVVKEIPVKEEKSELPEAVDNFDGFEEIS